LGGRGLQTKHGKYPSPMLRLNIAIMHIQKQEKSKKKKNMHITQKRNKERKLKYRK